MRTHKPQKIQNKQYGLKPRLIFRIFIHRVGQQIQEISRKAMSISIQASTGCPKAQGSSFISFFPLPELRTGKRKNK